jgi:hypothetical protein
MVSLNIIRNYQNKNNGVQVFFIALKLFITFEIFKLANLIQEAEITLVNPLLF